MIERIIKKRMDLFGVNQNDLAEQTELTTAQISLFLGGSPINQKSVEKLLSVLDIDIQMYEKRFDLAMAAAETLKHKEIPVDKVIAMSKEQMANVCEQKDILLFYDIKEKDASLIIEAKLVDYESTFVFLKAMVVQMMNSNLSFKKSDYIASWNKTLVTNGIASSISKKLPTINAIGNVGSVAALALLGGPLTWLAIAGTMMLHKNAPSHSTRLNILSKEILRKQNKIEDNSDLLKEKSDQSSKEKIYTTRERILNEIKKDPKIKILTIANILNISTRAVEKNIKKMREEDVIVREGSKKNSRWIVPPCNNDNEE